MARIKAVQEHPSFKVAVTKVPIQALGATSPAGSISRIGPEHRVRVDRDECPAWSAELQQRQDSFEPRPIKASRNCPFFPPAATTGRMICLLGPVAEGVLQPVVLKGRQHYAGNSVTVPPLFATNRSGPSSTMASGLLNS